MLIQEIESTFDFYKLKVAKLEEENAELRRDVRKCKEDIEGMLEMLLELMRMSPDIKPYVDKLVEDAICLKKSKERDK